MRLTARGEHPAAWRRRFGKRFTAAQQLAGLPRQARLAGDTFARVVEHCGGADVRRELAQVGQRELRREGGHHVRQNRRVPLARLAWIVTVGASFITAALLFAGNYVGYGFVAIAIGLAAAINLR